MRRGPHPRSTSAAQWQRPGYPSGDGTERPWWPAAPFGQALGPPELPERPRPFTVVAQRAAWSDSGGRFDHQRRGADALPSPTEKTATSAPALLHRCEVVSVSERFLQLPTVLH